MEMQNVQIKLQLRSMGWYLRKIIAAVEQWLVRADFRQNKSSKAVTHVVDLICIFNFLLFRGLL